ncbi:MAG: hypothetical protein JWP97_6830 [Labilithrix sp.]|nr:hypothetical protein [Labilithrix sp.]
MTASANLRVLALVALPLLACSSTTSASSPAAERDAATSPDDGGVLDAAEESDAAPEHETWDECSDLDAPAAVTQEKGTGAAPKAEGGLLVDGRYALTRVQVYGASGLTSDQPAMALRIANGRMALRSPNSSISGTYTTSGTTLSWRVTCGCSPSSSTGEGVCASNVVERTYPFTSGPDGLILQFPYINGGTELLTFGR